MEFVALLLVVVLWLVGIAGVVIPIIPGPTLVMVSAWLYFLVSPTGYPWWVAAIATGVWAIGSVLDALASLLGAKAMGSSKWGIIGATVGLLVGIFFFPIGLILGPLLGAFAGELIFARRSAIASGKVGIGAGMGLLVGKLIQLLTNFAVIAVMIWGIYFLDK